MVIRGDATAAGLLLRSWNAGGEGGAAILYDWERGVLEAVFEGGAGLDLATQPELDAGVDGQRRIGGPVDLRPGEALTVRALPPVHRGFADAGRRLAVTVSNHGSWPWWAALAGISGAQLVPLPPMPLEARMQVQ